MAILTPSLLVEEKVKGEKEKMGGEEKAGQGKRRKGTE